QPGTKETRYAHLLSGDVETAEMARSGVEATSSDDRIGQLEAEVADLRREMAELRERVERLVS
ncbi:MAG: DUF480 domain-containing protein, partial [Silvibacterium sp.]